MGSDHMDDPDADGVVNLFEYALGTDPLNKSSVPEMSVKTVQEGDREFIAFEYKKLNDRSDVVLSIERSFDLRQWESGEGFTRSYSIQNGESGYLIVTEISSLPLSQSIHQNLRLSVKLIR